MPKQQEQENSEQSPWLGADAYQREVMEAFTSIIRTARTYQPSSREFTEDVWHILTGLASAVQRNTQHHWGDAYVKVANEGNRNMMNAIFTLTRLIQSEETQGE